WHQPSRSDHLRERDARVSAADGFPPGRADCRSGLRAALLRFETRARLGHDRGPGWRRLRRDLQWLRKLRASSAYLRKLLASRGIVAAAVATRDLEPLASGARSDGTKARGVWVNRAARGGRAVVLGRRRGLRRDVQAACARAANARTFEWTVVVARGGIVFETYRTRAAGRGVFGAHDLSRTEAA